MTIHGADSRGLPAPVATTVGASRRERGHWAWISSLTIASLGGLNFLPCAVLWILLLSAPEGEGGGILFVALMILSLNATVVLSAGGIGLAVAGIASPRQTTWPAVIALVLNAAPLGGYALMFGIAWVCSL